MVEDVNTVIKNSVACNRTGTKLDHLRDFVLFPPSVLFDFFSMHILGALLKAKAGNQFVIVMKDRYTELIPAIPVTKVTLTQITNIFTNDWIATY